MPDPRFYRRAGPHSLAFIAKIAGAELGAGINPSHQYSDVGPLSSAGPKDVSFALADTGDALRLTRAGVCLVAPELATHAPSTTIALSCRDPRHSFAAVAAAFYPPRDQLPALLEGRAKDADVAIDAVIEHGAIIGARAVIGARSRVGANAVVGPGVVIGRDCWIGANVVLSHCIIGDHVVLHPGTMVGQAGFGFAPGGGGIVRVPQLGRVLIKDRVELGANCTVDRGAFSDTVIGAGTKTDDLVHIGHSAVIGANCMFVAQSGVAGSTVLGDGVVVGGQVGIADHLTIGDGARIASKSGVMRDIAPGEAVMGYPAKPIKRFWREVATLGKLTEKPRS